MNHILFFDGECRYCSRWVQWVVERDKNHCFRFASLQSDFAREAFPYFNIDEEYNSIVILKNMQSDNFSVIVKSEAVAFLLSILKPDAFLYKLIKITPRLFADFGYDCISAIRRFLPVSECRFYNDEEKKLFLDEINLNELLFRFRHKK